MAAKRPVKKTGKKKAPARKAATKKPAKKRVAPKKPAARKAKKKRSTTARKSGNAGLGTTRKETAALRKILKSGMD